MKLFKIDKDQIYLTAFLIFIFVASTALTYVLYSSKTFSAKESEAQNYVPESPSTLVKDSPDTFNILLLGYGGAGHSGGTLSDSITLVSINTKDKETVLVSIPRDLWIALPDDYDNTSNYKINMAYAIGIDDTRYPNKKPIYRGEKGGGELAKYAASVVTDLDIQHFISVDFGNLIGIVDLLGGIEVNVSKPFDDFFYPVKGLENETCGYSGEEIARFHELYSGFQLEKQFECRYEHLHFDKGLQKMDGETVLKFVRSRHSSQYGGDFARSERQHEVLAGIKDKIISLEGFSQASPIYQKIVDSVTTDLTKEDIKEIITAAGNPLEYKISHIYLTEDNVFYSSTSSNGQYILIPREGVNKWDAVHQYISGAESN